MPELYMESLKKSIEELELDKGLGRYATHHSWPIARACPDMHQSRL